jgi:Xaa-Pro aminopeptidase
MSYERRVKHLQRSLARRKAAFLVLCQENRRYLAGFSPEDVSLTERSGALLLTPKEAFLLTDPRYQEEARECAPLFEPVIYRRGLVAELSRLLPRLGVKRLLFEEAYLSVAGYKRLKEKLPEVSLEGVKGFIERLRVIKDEEEVAFIRRALALAEEILTEAAELIAPGRTEKEIAAKIIELSHRLADGPSFPPIVASGPLSARPHAEPSARTLRPGEPVIIDMGVKYQGYCSDITRTFCVGTPTPRFLEVYRLVLRAKEAAEKEIRAGVLARVPDLAARQVFKEAGVEKYFCHSLGHGVGLAIHEGPSLSFRSRKKLRSGQVVTVEPGLYFPDWGGIRLEDMVVVREGGAERLNHLGFLKK